MGRFDMPFELSPGFSRWIEKVVADPQAEKCPPATTGPFRRVKLSVRDPQSRNHKRQPLLLSPGFNSQQVQSWW